MPEADSFSLSDSGKSDLDTRDSEGTVDGSDAGLSQVEAKIIEFFVSVTKLLAIPKSVGEIYGLLFCSPEPRSVAEMTAKLGLSKATASYALRFLADINAIAVTKKFGDRHDRYLAETSLRKIALGFLSERLDPFMEDREADLQQLTALGEEVPDEEETTHEESAEPSKDFLNDRIRMLAGWQSNVHQSLPLLKEFFRSTS